MIMIKRIMITIKNIIWIKHTNFPLTHRLMLVISLKKAYSFYMS